MKIKALNNDSNMNETKSVSLNDSKSKKRRRPKKKSGLKNTDDAEIVTESKIITGVKRKSEDLPQNKKEKKIKNVKKENGQKAKVEDIPSESEEIEEEELNDKDDSTENIEERSEAESSEVEDEVQDESDVENESETSVNGDKMMSGSAISRRKCINNPDSFCYICGTFTIPSQRANISTFVKQAYFAYFKVKLGDQDKTWAPHKVCKQCVESLRMWTKGTRDKLPFGIPMVWREPRDHFSDCYFCIVKTSGYNKKNKCNIEYPSLPSAIRPEAHSAEITVPVFVKLLPLEELSDNCDEDFEIKEDSVPERFDQHELNDLTRDLGLSKKASELLASRLNEKNLLEKGTKGGGFGDRKCFVCNESGHISRDCPQKSN